MKKVLQINFSSSWDSGGCLPHIAKAWVRNSQRYQHDFTSSTGSSTRTEIAGRPHLGFYEDKRANRIYNKTLRLNKFCFFALLPIIEELKPDVLHFHNRHDLVDQIMAKLSYRPKVVCMYHLCYNKLFIPETSDMLLGVGKFVAAWIERKADPEQILAVVHNPLWKVTPVERKPRAKPLFLNYANKNRPTGHLFEAIKKLQTEGFDFDVRVVGHSFGGLPLPSNTQATGWIPQPEFLELAAQASAYICATYATPFSVAVVEAIARRTPVICPWDIGAVDLLPSDSVIEYESHSADTIADAMRRFLQMPEKDREAMADRALAVASDVYDETKLTAKLENLYDKLFA